MDFKFDYKQKIIVNGKEYSSIDELPPEMREMVKNIFSKNHQLENLDSALKAVLEKSGFDFKIDGNENTKKIFDVSFTTSKETFPADTMPQNIKDTINAIPAGKIHYDDYANIKPIGTEPATSGRKVLFSAFIVLVIILVTAYLLF